MSCCSLRQSCCISRGLPGRPGPPGQAFVGSQGPEGPQGPTGSAGLDGMAILNSLEVTFDDSVCPEGVLAIGPTAPNVNLAIGPSGTGFISAQVPDAMVAGGDCRGPRAVDWQLLRTTANQVAGASSSFIGNGLGNRIVSGSDNSGILSGRTNLINPSINAAIVGGKDNSILDSNGSVIGAGQLNIIESSSKFSFIGAGFNNGITGSTGVGIASGRNNLIIGSTYSEVVSGQNNTINPSSFSVIGAGYGNSILNTSASIIGAGSFNRVTNDAAIIGAGSCNLVAGPRSMIGAGFGNKIPDDANSMIGAGICNYVKSDNCMIGAGKNNGITGSSHYSFIGAGQTNLIQNARYAAILNGRDLTIQSGHDHAVIMGGTGCLSNGAYTTTVAGKLFIKTVDTDGEGAGDFLMHCGTTGVTGGEVKSASFCTVIDNYCLESDLCPEPAQSGRIIFVDSGVTGGTGNSWLDPIDDLQDALDQASFGDEIWVKKGTYSFSLDFGGFNLVSGVKLFGGFQGFETQRNQRNPDPKTNGTVLTTSLTTGTRRILDPGASTSLETLVDGFKITGGVAGGDGGAILVNGRKITLRRCWFIDNEASDEGGAIFGQGSCEIVICDCLFEYNTALEGGAIYIITGTVTVLNSRFEHHSNGTVVIDAASGKMVNCLLANNNNCTFSIPGGAVQLTGSSSTVDLINTSIVNNRSENGGGGIDVQGTSPTLNLENSILWHNNSDRIGEGSQITNTTGTLTVADCLIEDADSLGIVNGGTLVVKVKGVTKAVADIKKDDPLFVSPPNNFQLSTLSPAINCGLNTHLTDLSFTVPVDLAGNTRILGGAVDMGAYEHVESTKVLSKQNGNLISVDLDDRICETIDTKLCTSITDYCLESDLCVEPVQSGAVWFVDSGLTGGTGLSWLNPLSDLAVALARASEGDEIWVKKGIYATSDSGGFDLKNGVKLFGGFNGFETERNQRNSDPETNGTVLTTSTTGQILDPSASTSLETLVDGFKITGGSTTLGGALKMDTNKLTLQNCWFTENTASSGGGAIFVDDDSELIICNCLFRDNTTTSSSSGTIAITQTSGSSTMTILNTRFEENTDTAIYVLTGPTVQLVNCVFINNTATVLSGGALHLDVGTVTVVNNSFSGNSISGSGGAISVVDGTLNLQNSILWGNQASSGTASEILVGGIATVNIFDCLIEDASTTSGISNSGTLTVSIQGDTVGKTVNDIKDDDPLFMNPPANLRLSSLSPAINCGLNSHLTALSFTVPVDLSGNTRILGGAVDMGAYEHVTSTKVLTKQLNNLISQTPEQLICDTFDQVVGCTGGFTGLDASQILVKHTRLCSLPLNQIPYELTSSNSGFWTSPVPATLQEAIDRIASEVSSQHGTL